MKAVRFCAGTAGARTNEEQIGCSTVWGLSLHREYRVAPARWEKRHGGECEAGTQTLHVCAAAWFAADLFARRSAIVRVHTAATSVQAFGAAAFGGGADRAWKPRD